MDILCVLKFTEACSMSPISDELLGLLAGWLLTAGCSVLAGWLSGWLLDAFFACISGTLPVFLHGIRIAGAQFAGVFYR